MGVFVIFLPLFSIVFLALSTIQSSGMESSLESSSFETVESIFKKTITSDNFSGDRIKLEVARSSHKSQLKSCTEYLLPKFELVYSAVEKWKESLNKGEELLSVVSSSDICKAQSKALLITLEAVLNTKYLEEYVFSPWTNRKVGKVSFANIPTDFNVDHNTSQYYGETCSFQPCTMINLECQGSFNFDIMYSPAFENLVRGVMIVALGRVDQGDNRTKMECLIKNAKKEFEIVQWKSKHYVESVSKEIQILKMRIINIEDNLKKNYIIAIKAKEKQDREERAKKEVAILQASLKYESLTKMSDQYFNIFKK
jgi:hypothetical protein